MNPHPRNPYSHFCIDLSNAQSFLVPGSPASQSGIFYLARNLPKQGETTHFECITDQSNIVSKKFKTKKWEGIEPSGINYFYANF